VELLEQVHQSSYLVAFARHEIACENRSLEQVDLSSDKRWITAQKNKNTKKNHRAPT
jgi:hypothetical protein